MKRKETPGLSWGLLWFAAAYAPQTGILIPVNALLLEHWMYLPTAGLALGLAQYAATQLKQLVLTKILAATACMGAIVLAVATYQQNTLWHDPVVFYRNILEQGEVSVRAHNNLGMALTDNGDYTGAMEQFQAALKIRDAAETHQNIASLYSRIPEGGPKMVPQEIAELQRALDIDPNYYQAAKDLAFLYGYSGDAEKAAEYSQRAEAIRQKYTRYP
jgi:tetratricopeptide (TPR) repeat protein